MTSVDSPLPVPDDDALAAAASAIVDGVATPEETALVASSPYGPACVAALRAVAQAVAHPVPAQSPTAAATAIAAAIAAALGAADATVPISAAVPPAPGTALADTSATRLAALDALYGHAPTEPAAEPDDTEATVVTLPPRPSASSARWLPRLGAVAAALVLLVGIGALMVGLLDTENPKGETQASAPEAGVDARTTGPLAKADRSAAPADSKADSNSTAGAPSAPQPAAEASAPLVVDGGDFGNQTDLQALVQRAAAALDSAPDPSTTSRDAALATDVQACVNDAPVAANEPLGALRYRATGSFQGSPAVALAYDRPGTPPRLLLILTRQSCSVLATTPF